MSRRSLVAGMLITALAALPVQGFAQIGSGGRTGREEPGSGPMMQVQG